MIQLPGEIRQVGHVVADLDAAMAEWLAMGVGPWTALEPSSQSGVYRGQPTEASVAVGFSHVGPLQVELIEAVGDGSAIWHEARDAGRFGPHHVAYWSEDFDASLRDVERTGLQVVQSGGGDGIPRFVYLQSPSEAMMVEIMELNELSVAFMDHIRATCEGWDGSGDGVLR